VFGGFDVQEYTDESSPASGHVRALIDDMLRSKKTVAALCAGQKVLAAAGYLQGKQASYNRNVADAFPASGALWKAQPVTADGGLITGADPRDAVPFARELLKHLRAAR